MMDECACSLYDDPEEQKRNEFRKKIQMYPKFDIVLMSNETNKYLNLMLKPHTAISENFRNLADKLGFDMKEIQYIEEKPYPVLYILDQYVKRAIQNAALNTSMKHLHEIFLQMKRYDAAEKIQQELEVLQEKDPKEVTHKEHVIKAKIKRQLYGKEEMQEAKLQKNEMYIDVKEKDQSENFDKAGKKDVYIAYCADNERHVKTVHRFAKKLKSVGINATSDLYERMQYEYDRGFYIQQSLLKADQVIVVCSAKFNKFYDCYLSGKTDSLEQEEKEEFKKVSFYMRIITSDIFAGGSNGKYIPVIFNSINQSNIPSVLKSSTQYVMERDFTKLKFRLLGIEQYKLPPLPKDNPVVQTETLSSGFKLLKLIKRTEK